MRGMTAILMVLLLAGCASNATAQQPASDPPLQVDAASITPAEADSLRVQIESNWNVDSSLECHAKLTLRAVLAADGTVQRVENGETFAQGDPCLVLQESGRRAILVSSPLKVPAGKTWPSIAFTFAAERLLQQ